MRRSLHRRHRRMNDSRTHSNKSGVLAVSHPVSTFHDAGFFRHPLLPFRPFSPVVARSSSLSRLLFDLLPDAGSSSLHAPPKSKICPLWLILPFQTPGTENSQTVKQKIHKQNTQ
ncbi:hypothetical protein TNCV_2712801 [Trichonephila clavipes]|uniref:Uncharacterized protein n=1 Tax=Trichonephila clavipes TaxID=2585209 RepID=A0A8X6RDH3_TRICX|nr:hypothetical protein TNCV_2712801 [Trichonephila clavipes]